MSEEDLQVGDYCICDIDGSILYGAIVLMWDRKYFPTDKSFFIIEGIGRTKDLTKISEEEYFAKMLEK